MLFLTSPRIALAFFFSMFLVHVYLLISQKPYSSWLVPSMYCCLLLLPSGRTWHSKTSPSREGAHCMIVHYFTCDSVHSFDGARLAKVLCKRVRNMKVTFFHSTTVCHTVWSYLLPVLGLGEFTEPITSCQGSLTEKLVGGFAWKMLFYSASFHHPAAGDLQAAPPPRELHISRRDISSPWSSETSLYGPLFHKKLPFAVIFYLFI